MLETIWFLEKVRFLEDPERASSKLFFSEEAKVFRMLAWDQELVEIESREGTSVEAVILITDWALTIKAAGTIKKQKTKTYIVQNVIPNQKNWDTNVKVSSWGI